MSTRLFLAMCLALSGCMKSVDLDPLPDITRVDVLRSEELRIYPPPFEIAKIPPLAAFIDGQRHGWTRAIAVGFGPPSPVYYAHVYSGGRYLGYFAVGAAVLPGSAALFQVRYGDIYAQKRVTRSEANKFLDLIGVGGELR